MILNMQFGGGKKKPTCVRMDKVATGTSNTTLTITISVLEKGDYYIAFAGASRTSNTSVEHSGATPTVTYYPTGTISSSGGRSITTEQGHYVGQSPNGRTGYAAVYAAYVGSKITVSCTGRYLGCCVVTGCSTAPTLS